MEHWSVGDSTTCGIRYLVAKTYGHLRDAPSFEMAKRMTFSANEKPPENVVPMDHATTA